MNDNVNHPSHYTTSFGQTSIECIDITRHLNFDIGNAFKYIWRAGHKGTAVKAVEDLNKALWYIKDWRSNLLGEKGSSLAVAIFKLLPIPEGGTIDALRHTALSQLLGDSTQAAEETVYAMLHRFKEALISAEDWTSEAGVKTEDGEDS